MANLQANPFPRAVDITPNGTIVDGMFTFRFPFEMAPNVSANGDLMPLQLALEIETATRPAGADEWNLILPASNAGCQTYFTQGLAAGYQEINFGQSGLVGGSLTGLNEGDASGYQVVDVGGSGIFTGSLTTGLISGMSGFQAVDVGAAVTGGSTTGLANNSTQYNATVTVDGLFIQVLVIGSTAQTYSALINQLNTDLGGLATAAIVNGDLRITSNSKGSSSTVLITAGTLFSTLTGFASILPASPGSVQTYDLDIEIDGAAPVTLIVQGSNALTYFALVSHLNDLTSGATWAIVDGDLKLTSDTKGVASSILITDGTTGGAVLPLVASLLPASSILADVAGTSTTYTMQVTTSGTGAAVHNINFLGKDAHTISNLITQLNADMTTATASLVGGKIRITKNNTGAGEDVEITNNGNLIDALKGQFGVGATVMPKVIGSAAGGGKAFGDVGFRASYSFDGARATWMLTVPSDATDTLPHSGSPTTLLPPGVVSIEVEAKASDTVNTYFYGDIDGANGFVQRMFTYTSV